MSTDFSAPTPNTFTGGIRGDAWLKPRGWSVSSRPQRVAYALLGIWLFNAVDLALTLVAHQHGLLDEQNPVAGHVIQAGMIATVLYKLGLLMIGTYPLLRFRATASAELGAYTALCAYAGVALYWLSVAEWYAVTLAHRY